MIAFLDRLSAFVEAHKVPFFFAFILLIAFVSAIIEGASEQEQTTEDSGDRHGW